MQNTPETMRRTIALLEETHPEDALDAALSMAALPMSKDLLDWVRTKRL